MASVACIELNPSGAFFHLSPYEDFRKFSYMHILMYPSATLSLLPDILCQPTEYFVLDFGVLNSNTYQAFARCDYKIMLGNICPWKWEHYSQILKKLSTEHWNFYKDMKLLGIPGEKENLKKVHKYVSNSIMPVPFIENPFRITSANFGFFNRLLEI